MGPLIELRFEIVEENVLREGHAVAYWYVVPREGEYVHLADGTEGFVTGVVWVSGGAGEWVTVRLTDRATLDARAAWERAGRG